MSAQKVAVAVDLDCLVAGDVRVHVDGAETKIWCAYHTPLRNALHKALQSPQLNTLGLSPERVVIVSCNQLGGTITIGLEKI